MWKTSLIFVSLKIFLKGKWEIAEYSGLSFTHTHGKFRVWFLHKKRDGSPKGLLYENASVLNRAGPHRCLSVPGDTSTSPAACDWWVRSLHAGSHAAATSHPGVRMPCLRLFRPLSILCLLEKGTSALKAIRSPSTRTQWNGISIEAGTAQQCGMCLWW